MEPIREMVKLIVNSFYENTITKYFEEEFCFNTAYCMQTQFAVRVEEDWRLPIDDYSVKLTFDERVDSPVDNKNTMPSQQ